MSPPLVHDLGCPSRWTTLDVPFRLRLTCYACWAMVFGRCAKKEG